MRWVLILGLVVALIVPGVAAAQTWGCSTAAWGGTFSECYPPGTLGNAAGCGTIYHGYGCAGWGSSTWTGWPTYSSSSYSWPTYSWPTTYDRSSYYTPRYSGAWYTPSYTPSRYAPSYSAPRSTQEWTGPMCGIDLFFSPGPGLCWRGVAR
jgi:hypothetical protein